MLNKSYEIDVLVNGKSVKEYEHNGKVFIEAKEGSKFTLRFRNNSGGRKLFVPSVDGLSVMDGKDASYKSSGYIVPAYGSLTVDGWRTSEKDVAEFYFASPSDSYAKRKAKGKHLGVIGVAVFDEKRKPLPIGKAIDIFDDIFPIKPFPLQPVKSPWWFGDQPWLGSGGQFTISSSSQQMTNGVTTDWENFNASGDNTGMLKASYQNSKGESYNKDYGQALGTGWGDKKESRVNMVEFDSCPSPDAVMSIYYNTREELEKLGISFKEPVYVSPQAFPGQFCEPPTDKN